MTSQALAISTVLCLLGTQTLQAQSAVYVAQDRRIEAFVHDEFRREDEEPLVVEVTRNAAAPDFADFDATVQAQDPRTGYSSISQRSSLAGEGISASGAWDGWASTNNGYYRFDTLVAATFDVTAAATRYDLTYRIDRPDVLPGRQDVTLLLRRAGDGGAVLFDVEPVYEEQPDHDYAAVGTRSGELAAGRYDFRFFERIVNDPGLSGGYAVSLRLSPVPEPGAVAALSLCAAAALPRGRRGRAS